MKKKATAGLNVNINNKAVLTEVQRHFLLVRNYCSCGNRFVLS